MASSQPRPGRGDDRRPPLTLRSRDFFDQGGPPGSGGQDSGEPEITPNHTLSQAYREAFLPLWAGPNQLSPETIELYDRAVALWCQLAPHPDLPADAETGLRPEPQLWELEGQRGEWIGARFQSGLAQQPGVKRCSKMSIGTIRKHVIAINKLLSFVGPRVRSRHGLKNLHVLDEPILLVPPASDQEGPEGNWSIEEVRAMWSAAAQMRSTRLRALGISAVMWWRAIITVAAHTGLRRCQLLGLSFADLEGDHIRVRAKRSKRRTGGKQSLSAECLKAIECIRTQRERVFVWPYQSRSKKHPDRAAQVNKRWLDVQLRLLAKRAGLPRDRWFGWNGFRKLAATSAFEIGGEDGARDVLGHATGSRTAMKHYVGNLAKAKRAKRIIDQLPSTRPDDGGDDGRQGMLFRR